MDGLEVYFKALAVKVHSTADISKWDTGKVTTMRSYVLSASAFNQDIGSWNTEKVTDMELCFIKLLRSTKTLGVGTQRK